MKRRSKGDSWGERHVGVSSVWVEVGVNIVKVGIIGIVGVKIRVLVVVGIVGM